MSAISIAELPKSIGTPEYVYDHVLKLLSRHGVETVLDCPAGFGAFSARLSQQGYSVSACDICDEEFELGDLVECKFADLNDRLPYEDNSFEAIVCLNGLHRVWARGRATTEFARVLADGGVLIVTNVNNVNLVHRMSFMACGSANYNTIGPPYGFHPDADNPAACYRAPLTIAEVLSIGASVGLFVESVASLKPSWTSLCLAPIAPLVWCMSFCLPRRFREHCYVGRSNGIAGMFSDYTAITLRKNRSA